MAVDKSQQAFVFPGDGSAGEAELRAAGAQHITRIDGKARTWRDAVRLVRAGDTVRVWALVKVPTRRGQDRLPPVAQVSDFVREVEARGGVLIEVYTGRTSAKKADKSAMIEAAEAALKSKGRTRLPGGFRKAGRRPMPISDAQREQARKAWFSKDYATNEIAVRHMPEGWTARRAWREFGVSGRPWPSKKRSKR